MQSDIFTIPGTLQMSPDPVSGLTTELAWADIGPNRYLFLLALIFFVLKLKDMLWIAPRMLDNLSRTRGADSFEYNMSYSRMRNSIAAATLLPFSLFIDRYLASDIAFLQLLPSSLRVFGSMGMVLIYLLIRWLCFALFRVPKLSYTYRLALRQGPCGIFFVLVCTMCISGGVLSLIHIEETILSIVLLAEIAMALLLSYLRSVQILALKYSSLISFLYLCALELMPLAIVVLGVIFL